MLFGGYLFSLQIRFLVLFLGHDPCPLWGVKNSILARVLSDPSGGYGWAMALESSIFLRQWLREYTDFYCNMTLNVIKFTPFIWACIMFRLLSSKNELHWYTIAIIDTQENGRDMCWPSLCFVVIYLSKQTTSCKNVALNMCAWM